MRSDDAADGMTARENDAAMIHHCVGPNYGGQILRDFGALHDCAPTGRAPVCFCIRREHGVTVTADTLHKASVEDASTGAQIVSAIAACALARAVDRPPFGAPRGDR